MPAEDAEELARELSEFGYRATDEIDEADRRRFYKVERRDAAEVHVLELVPPAKTLAGLAPCSPPRRNGVRAGLQGSARRARWRRSAR